MEGDGRGYSDQLDSAQEQLSNLHIQLDYCNHVSGKGFRETPVKASLWHVLVSILSGSSMHMLLAGCARFFVNRHLCVGDIRV